MISSFGYLMSVTTSQNDVEVLLAISNTAGRGEVFHGSSNGVTNTQLSIIPNGRKDREEVIAQLQALPSVLSVSVVTLSKPVIETELAGVRELFAGIGWDASSITDDELLLFINSKLQGQYTYYVDYDLGKMRNKPVKIRIKRIEEHPHFSPDWLRETKHIEEDELERDITIDDIEIRSITMEHTGKVEPPPPPPPRRKQ